MTKFAKTRSRGLTEKQKKDIITAFYRISSAFRAFSAYIDTVPRGANMQMQKEVFDMTKNPFATADQIREIAKTHPTPFYLYDEAGIRENARRLQKAFSWNPGFREYFAVKATPNPYLLQIFKEEHCFVDCSSLTELMLADTVGFHGDEIMFSSNATPDEDYRLAAKLGAIVNFDDLTHIPAFDGIASFGETASCRFNPGGDFTMGNTIMNSPKDAKFGMPEDQLKQAFLLLKERGVKRFGIHAFLASNTTDERYYPKLASILFSLAVRVYEETGIAVSFVNLSGGIGVPYKPEDKPADIEVIGRGVKEAYDRILVPAGLGNVSIFTELGRFMMAPYGALVSRVLRFKHTWKEYVGLDACAANLMRPAMYGCYHHITLLGKENAPAAGIYDVTGGLCENNDKFAVDRPLPQPEIGDFVWIHDTGAHGHSMGYNYNGKLRSAELLLCTDGSVKQIRRAETPDDYFATLDLTPFRK